MSVKCRVESGILDSPAFFFTPKEHPKIYKYTIPRADVPLDSDKVVSH